MPNQYPRYECGSVCSEDENQRAHLEYDEEQHHCPSYGGDTSVSGQDRQHPSWHQVVGITASGVKGQPAYAADRSTSYSDPSFRGLSSTSFQGNSGLPPYHISTSLNDTYRARSDIGSVGRQHSSAFGGSTNPGYAVTHQEDYPSSTNIYYGDHSRYGRGLMSANNAHVQTPSSSELAANPIYQTGKADTHLYPGIIPRSSVETPRGYNDYYSQQSPGDQGFGDRHPSPPNALRPQPQAIPISGTRWQQGESTKALQMRKEKRTWAEISKDSGRSIEACKGRRRLVNERKKARTAAKDQANVPDVHMIGPHCIDWSDEKLINWARDRVRTVQDEQSVTFQSACKKAAQELNAVHKLRIAGSTVEWCVEKNATSDIEDIQHTDRGRE